MDGLLHAARHRSGWYGALPEAFAPTTTRRRTARWPTGSPTIWLAMAAPKHAPTGPHAPRYYSSPEVVPSAWSPERPGIVEGLQPTGSRLGAQGPDQGFALTIASRLAPKLHLQPRERRDDAVRGCVNIALRRASLFSRAPVVHDVNLAFTIWGFFLEQPPAELLARRAELFEGVGNVLHHYAEGRVLADLVPVETLRMTPSAAAAVMPVRWRELTGA